MVDRNNAIDLHGLTVDEALAAFVEHYNSRVRSGRGGCIKVVHGYGSSGEGGVIRGRLLRLLASHADKLRYEDGQQYGNPGWTLVYPGELLPGRQDTLDHRILGLCQEPKSEEKILQKFATYGERLVRDRVQHLVRQQQLKPLPAKARIKYQSC